MDAADPVVFRIRKAARPVHTTLGPGFIEKRYTGALIAELMDNGFHAEREKTIKIW